MVAALESAIPGLKLTKGALGKLLRLAGLAWGTPTAEQVGGSKRAKPCRYLKSKLLYMFQVSILRERYLELKESGSSNDALSGAASSAFMTCKKAKAVLLAAGILEKRKLCSSMHTAIELMAPSLTYRKAWPAQAT
jgi:hypothetical protein